MAFPNWYLGLLWKLAFELLTLSWKAYNLVAIKLVSIFLILTVKNNHIIRN